MLPAYRSDSFQRTIVFPVNTCQVLLAIFSHSSSNGCKTQEASAQRIGQQNSAGLPPASAHRRQL
jgi:hypothetical protein